MADSDGTAQQHTAVEFDEPFDAFNNPAAGIDCPSEYSDRSGRDDDEGGDDDDDILSEAVEDDFLRRYESLNRSLSEPYMELPPSALTIYGETTTFSEKNIILWMFVIGPEFMQMIATIVLCTAPVIVQTVIYTSELTTSLHILTWMSLAATIASLMWTSLSDPCVAPKRMTTLEPAPPRIRLFVNDKETVGLRYCPTCDIYRGPRTHHCGVCGNCVDQFDHHCPWTGTCIGAKNYHRFLCFLHAIHLLASFIVISSTEVTVSVSRSRNIGIVDALGEVHYVPIVLIGFILLSGVSVTGLLFFHWYLLIRNLTTAEFLKSAYASDGDNPWDLGILHNIFAKFTGWVDKRTYSGNFCCYVVREVVRREMDMLAREREEEIKIQRERRHSHPVAVTDVRVQDVPPLTIDVSSRGEAVGAPPPREMDAAVLELFPHLTSESIIETFNCALSERGALNQGVLYVTKHWIAFNAAVLSKRFSVRFDDVNDIRKAKFMNLFNNSIEIETNGGDVYFLSSFIHRDIAFTALLEAQQNCNDQ